MTLRKLWPGSLGGRAVAILVAAVVLVHLGSMFAYRENAITTTSMAEAAQLAERVATATRAINSRSAEKRDQVAHDLSSAGLSLRWSDRTAVETIGGHEPALETMRKRLAELLPEARGDGIRVDFADLQPPGDAHAIIGSVRLPDGSFVSFSMPRLAETGSLLHSALLSTSLMAGGIAVVAILLVRMLVSPLRDLARAADAIGRGPGVTVNETGPDEVRHVAQAFNAMQSRIHRLISDRTHALAAVSHDLRTPITRLRMRAGFIKDQEAQAAVDADLDEMEAMIDATLAYLKGEAEPEPPRAIDLASLLATVIDSAADAGRSAFFNGPRHAYLTVRGLAIKRVFTNLIDNALTYGRIARVTLHDGDQEIRVVVDDDGPGIPDRDLSRVFEPFVRLDDSRNRRTGGVGLGLAIVRQAVEREGGSVSLLNRAEGGLRAEIVIPRRAGEAQSRPAPGEPHAAAPLRLSPFDMQETQASKGASPL